MIAQLEGAVGAIGATWLLISVGGVGLKASCTPAAVAAARLGEPVTLHTSLVVREDSLTLYGFDSSDERDAFELVQTASGIGPKIAMAVVSVLSPEELRSAIITENLVTLMKVPGIGRKGAQKMVIELKDKVNSLEAITDLPSVPETAVPLWREQVRSGLESLGWSARDAEAACNRVEPLAQADPPPGVGELMRAALRTLAK